MFLDIRHLLQDGSVFMVENSMKPPALIAFNRINCAEPAESFPSVLLTSYGQIILADLSSWRPSRNVLSFHRGKLPIANGTARCLVFMRAR